MQVIKGNIYRNEDGEYYVEYFEYYDKDEAENDFMLIEII